MIWTNRKMKPEEIVDLFTMMFVLTFVIAATTAIVSYAYETGIVQVQREEVELAGVGTDTPQITEEVPMAVEPEEPPESVTLEPPTYILAGHRPKTYVQLHNDLEHVADPPYPHDLYVYDCSQMSAFMEYQLEAKGYDTTISCSNTRGHAWVTVHNIIDHNSVDIECIPPVHINPVHHPIEYSYENITEALNGPYPKEFDWWLEPREWWEK